MKPKIQKIISIITSIVILITGSITIYYVNMHLKNPVVNAQTTLGQSPKTTVNKNLSLDLKQIINLNQKKVVSIEVDLPDGKGQGSGFLYPELFIA